MRREYNIRKIYIIIFGSKNGQKIVESHEKSAERNVQ